MLSVANWKQFRRHPLSEIFPDMSEVEFEMILTDMREHGYDQKQQVIMFEGKVIDGWNRFRAAIMTDRTPTFDEYKGTDPLGFVIRRNLRRRHLSESQRAMVAANLATGKRGGTHSPNLGNGPEISTVKAGEMLNVSHGSVDNAKTVLKNGTPELKQAVMDGIAAVSDAAKIAKEPPKKQRAAIRKKKSGKSPTLTSAVSDADESKKELKDEEGHPVPDSCYQAFANLEKFKELISWAMQGQKMIDELSRLPGGEDLKHHLTPTGDAEKTINKSNHLNLLKADIKGCSPYAVCPDCKASGKKQCRPCVGTGWVTKEVWKFLQSKK
jgi:hypothetical protein